MRSQIEAKMGDFYKWYETIIPDAPKWVEHCKARAEK